MTVRDRAGPLLAVVGAVVVVLGLAAATGCAEPGLLLYPSGGVYDQASESWVVHSPTVDLWVISTWDQATLTGVKVSAAASAQEFSYGSVPTGMIDNDVGGWDVEANPQQLVAGSAPWRYGTPVMGSGQSLPGHGAFPTYFLQTVALPDFVPDVPGLDNPEWKVQQIYVPPTTGSEPVPAMVACQVKHVRLTISGLNTVYFDAYNHYVASNDKTRAKFAPFSEDAAGNVPEPGTLLLLGVGGLGLIGVGRRARSVKEA